MISTIGNRWAIRGPHQSLLLSLLGFRYSGIRFNMLSSFLFIYFSLCVDFFSERWCRSCHSIAQISATKLLAWSFFSKSRTLFTKFSIIHSLSFALSLSLSLSLALYMCDHKYCDTLMNSISSLNDTSDSAVLTERVAH